jgi:methionyl-tRNA formyltransferase
MRIIFMGTPEFASCILNKLIEANKNIVAVVTAPDKPAGRGRSIQESDVKKLAIDKSIPVLQPTNLKAPEFVEELKSYNADLFVVVAFRMLPEVVWNMPPKGTINLHGSLLPQYRGAAPINWAVMNGEKETGVTTFFIEKEIDTGKIIEQAKITIAENETVREVHDRLMHLGADLTLQTVELIESNDSIESKSQNDFDLSQVKHAPKIFKEDCLIDWNKPAHEVHNFIRGLSPYPAAWTILRNRNSGETKTFKLFISSKTDLSVNEKTIQTTKEGLLFPCSDNYILITELQPEGKRRMNFKEFLAGNDLKDWEISSL